jgi:hypothetical protein
MAWQRPRKGSRVRVRDWIDLDDADRRNRPILGPDFLVRRGPDGTAYSPREKEVAASGGVIAYTTSGISAMTGSYPTFTYGKGTATLMKEVTSGTDLQSASTGIGITVYNSLPEGIPSGDLIQVKVVNGRYFVDVDPCPSS